MHLGWALWCSFQMWGFEHPVWRALAVAYPSLLLVVVLATGNHFLLDVLAGGVCVALAHVVVGSVLSRAGRASSTHGRTPVS